MNGCRLGDEFRTQSEARNPFAWQISAAHYGACARATVTIEDMVPIDRLRFNRAPHRKNSLPVFSRFEKRFCCIKEDPNLLLAITKDPLDRLLPHFTTSQR